MRSWLRRVRHRDPADAGGALAGDVLRRARRADHGRAGCSSRLATPVQFYVGWPFLRRDGPPCPPVHRQHGHPDRDRDAGRLRLLGGAQLFAGGFLYFEVAAAIVALLALGRYFEARAKGRAGHALRCAARAGRQGGRVRPRRPGTAGRHRPRSRSATCSACVRARRSRSTARSSTARARSTSRC